MDCPYCNKNVYGVTGLQEAQAFSKHLIKCKKNPNLETGIMPDGDVVTRNKRAGLFSAVEIRHESGQ